MRTKNRRDVNWENFLPLGRIGIISAVGIAAYIIAWVSGRDDICSKSFLGLDRNASLEQIADKIIEDKKQPPVCQVDEINLCQPDAASTGAFET